MNLNQLSHFVNPALQLFLQRDRYLLENDVSELSITHKLATYMEIYLRKHRRGWPPNTPKYVVDCEFNREREDVKRLPLTNYLTEQREQLYAPCPDIIVHERGTNEFNAFVLEVKKLHGNSAKHQFLRALDLLKLACFIEPPLRYSFGMFLMFDTEGEDPRISEALLLTSESCIRMDEEKRKQLIRGLKHTWTEMQVAGLNRSNLAIRQDALELCEQIPFQNILSGCRTRLAFPLD